MSQEGICVCSTLRNQDIPSLCKAPCPAPGWLCADRPPAAAQSRGLHPTAPCQDRQHRGRLGRAMSPGLSAAVQTYWRGINMCRASETLMMSFYVLREGYSASSTTSAWRKCFSGGQALSQTFAAPPEHPSLAAGPRPSAP